MIRPPVLHLASTSPRRREILAALRLEFSVGHVDVDETPQIGETPADMVLRLAVAKAEAGIVNTRDLVLAADTAVVVDGRSLGKPTDERDCLAMLDALSGRGHKVLTGVALRGPNGTSTAMSSTDNKPRRSACILAKWGTERQSRRIRHPGTRRGVCRADRGQLFRRCRVACF
jgi:septum formation protein